MNAKIIVKKTILNVFVKFNLKRTIVKVLSFFIYDDLI